MTFKEFATNYLNPIFLMYRAVLIITSIWMMIFSLPFFVSSASGFEIMMIIGISIVGTFVLILKVKNVPYILYLWIPIFLSVISLFIRGTEAPETGVLFVPMILWLISSFLIVFNGIRSWGLGVSMNDINKKLDEYN